MDLKTLLESPWHSGEKTREGYVEVFVNPSRKEFEEVAGQSPMGKHVRFLACHSQKKVYIWNADILHQIMAKRLGFSYPIDDDCFMGVAVVLPGQKPRSVSAAALNVALDDYNTDRASKVFLNKFFRKGWKWVNEYITSDITIGMIRDRYKQMSSKGKEKNGTT